MMVKIFNTYIITVKSYENLTPLQNNKRFLDSICVFKIGFQKVQNRNFRRFKDLTNFFVLWCCKQNFPGKLVA